MTALTHLALVIALVFFFAVVENDAREHTVLTEMLQRQKVDQERINEAVDMCCPLDYAECCRESLLFRKPVNCTGLRANRRVHTVECMERHLYGNDQRPLVRDRICCEAFAGNDNDEEDVCRNLCNEVAMTPSLPDHAKCERIRHCKMANQGLHGCFDHCLIWHADHVDEPWMFEQHCDAEYKFNRLDTSEKYIFFESGESM